MDSAFAVLKVQDALNLPCDALLINALNPALEQQGEPGRYAQLNLQHP
ncbi:MAG: hypothetical protein WAO71_06645 [Gallionella sp.]